MSTPSTTFLALLLVCVGCSRSETQRYTAPPEPIGATTHNNVAESGTPGIGSEPPHTSKPACLVETPEESPPTALPASLEDCPKDPRPASELAHVMLTFPDAPSVPRVSVERATTNNERARGLMYRTEMGEDEGMIFSWPSAEIRSFWMRNTCIPLDMLFIAADGTIVGILEQVPVLNDSPRGVPCPAEHVLEMNAGWCRKHGVIAGQRVQIES